MLAHTGGAEESFSLLLLFSGLWVGWAGWSRLGGRGFRRLPAPVAFALVATGMALAVGAAVVPRAIFGPAGIPRGSPSVLRPSSVTAIAIVQPVPEQVVNGTTLDVVLVLRGGTIVDAATTRVTPTTGHVHISVDGKLQSMTYGLVQEISVAGLLPGNHTLEAEFVAADHGPFAPRVTSQVTFIVPGAKG